MTATLNGIVYEEIESPTFAGGRDGPTAQRTFKVAWSDADAFLAVFFPVSIRTGKGWISPISLGFPGKSYLAAAQFKREPFDPQNTTGYDANNVRKCAYAKIVIDYKAPDYDPNKKDPAKQGDQILADHSLAFSAEMLKLGVAGWVWETEETETIEDPDGGAPITVTFHSPIKNEDASLVKVVPQTEHSLNWNYVPSPPFKTISRSIGCVNSDERLFFAPAGTLLFVGAEIKRSYHSIDGEESWKVNYKFLQRNVHDGSGAIIGWNHLWRPDTGTWDRPLTSEGNRTLYETVKFNDLFQSDDSEDT